MVSRSFCQIASVSRWSTASVIVAGVPGWLGAGGTLTAGRIAAAVRSWIADIELTLDPAGEPVMRANRMSPVGKS